MNEVKTLGVGEIKAHFSEVLERVKGGEKIAVAYGKKRERVAVIVSYDEYRPKGRRKLGPLHDKARFEVCEPFQITDEELFAS